eukprot:TRINITY_DN10464_c0_g1_i1.p1 TRINITY_DN10464_c0_g1~~TRINITY_DN10464_c0_g1_i1.p1  ORF type:complete len:1958 (-),score=323.32 TRINITY_DN10464_c0_g1_i1:16-5889(-)
MEWDEFPLDGYKLIDNSILHGDPSFELPSLIDHQKDNDDHLKLMFTVEYDYTHMSEDFRESFKGLMSVLNRSSNFDWIHVYQKAKELNPTNPEEILIKKALLADILSGNVNRLKPAPEEPVLLSEIEIENMAPFEKAQYYLKLSYYYKEKAKGVYLDDLKNLVDEGLVIENPTYDDCFLLAELFKEDVRRLQRQRTNWNREQQDILSMGANTPEKKQEKHEKLSRFAQDFVYAAETYGKIIISEIHLPSSMKIIKPVKIGGFAGGAKYITQGILFKLAVDDKGIYGGDHNARKVAGHDLKGLVAYFQAQVEGLHVPLSCIIDYRGYRILAQSIIPIKGDSTLQYGSSDGGKTIINTNPELSLKMSIAARKLNLKEHIVNGVLLYSAADVEGHLGTDNRFYVLDFSRTFPPEPPFSMSNNGVSSHLFRLLRPELVKRNERIGPNGEREPCPLSSDAFSAFGEEEADIHHQEVLDCFNHLISTIIPEFAEEHSRKWIDHDDPQKELELKASLISDIHRAGINIRYLGLVYNRAINTRFREVILVEMICRIVKNQINKELRDMMEKLRTPGEEPYKVVYQKYFNIILKEKPELSEKYYSDWINKKIPSKFPGVKIEDQIFFSPSFTLEIIKRLQALTGVILSREPSIDDTVILESDIVKLQTRVKHMNISILSSAIAISMKASSDPNPIRAERLFMIAERRFSQALQTTGNSTGTYHEWAMMNLHQAMYVGDTKEKRLNMLKKSIDRCHKIPKNQRLEDINILITEIEIYIEMLLCSKKFEYVGKILGLYVSLLHNLSNEKYPLKSHQISLLCEKIETMVLPALEEYFFGARPDFGFKNHLKYISDIVSFPPVHESIFVRCYKLMISLLDSPIKTIVQNFMESFSCITPNEKILEYDIYVCSIISQFFQKFYENNLSFISSLYHDNNSICHTFWKLFVVTKNPIYSDILSSLCQYSDIYAAHNQTLILSIILDDTKSAIRMDCSGSHVTVYVDGEKKRLAPRPKLSPEALSYVTSLLKLYAALVSNENRISLSILCKEIGITEESLHLCLVDKKLPYDLRSVCLDLYRVIFLDSYPNNKFTADFKPIWILSDEYTNSDYFSPTISLNVDITKEYQDPADPVEFILNFIVSIPSLESCDEIDCGFFLSVVQSLLVVIRNNYLIESGCSNYLEILSSVVFSLQHALSNLPMTQPYEELKINILSVLCYYYRHVRLSYEFSDMLSQYKGDIHTPTTQMSPSDLRESLFHYIYKNLSLSHLTRSTINSASNLLLLLQHENNVISKSTFKLLNLILNGNSSYCCKSLKIAVVISDMNNDYSNVLEVKNILQEMDTSGLNSELIINCISRLEEMSLSKSNVKDKGMIIEYYKEIIPTLIRIFEQISAHGLFIVQHEWELTEIMTYMEVESTLLKITQFFEKNMGINYTLSFRKVVTKYIDTFSFYLNVYNHIESVKTSILSVLKILSEYRPTKFGRETITSLIFFFERGVNYKVKNARAILSNLNIPENEAYFECALSEDSPLYTIIFSGGSSTRKGLRVPVKRRPDNRNLLITSLANHRDFQKMLTIYNLNIPTNNDEPKIETEDTVVYLSEYINTLRSKAYLNFVTTFEYTAVSSSYHNPLYSLLQSIRYNDSMVTFLSLRLLKAYLQPNILDLDTLNVLKNRRKEQLISMDILQLLFPHILSTSTSILAVSSELFNELLIEDTEVLSFSEQIGQSRGYGVMEYHTCSDTVLNFLRNSFKEIDYHDIIINVLKLFYEKYSAKNVESSFCSVLLFITVLAEKEIIKDTRKMSDIESVLTKFIILLMDKEDNNMEMLKKLYYCELALMWKHFGHPDFYALCVDLTKKEKGDTPFSNRSQAFSLKLLRDYIVKHEDQVMKDRLLYDEEFCNALRTIILDIEPGVPDEDTEIKICCAYELICILFENYKMRHTQTHHIEKIHTDTTKKLKKNRHFRANIKKSKKKTKL